MISRTISRVPKTDVVNPGLLYCELRFAHACPQHSQACRQCSQSCRQRSQACGLCSQAWCRCFQDCCRCSQACHQCSDMLPASPEGHCISPVNSGNWPPWDSGLTARRYSQRLPEMKIHLVDVLETRLLTASTYVSMFTWLRPPNWSLSSLNGHLQAHLELLSITSCRMSRYTLCRWITI